MAITADSSLFSPSFTQRTKDRLHKDPLHYHPSALNRGTKSFKPIDASVKTTPPLSKERVNEIKQTLLTRRVPTPTYETTDSDEAYSDIKAEKHLKKYLSSTSINYQLKRNQLEYAKSFISRDAVDAALPLLTNEEITEYCIRRWKGENLKHTVIPTLPREQVSPTAVSANFHNIAKADIINEINNTLTPLPKQRHKKLQRSNSLSNLNPEQNSLILDERVHARPSHQTQAQSKAQDNFCAIQ